MIFTGMHMGRLQERTAGNLLGSTLYLAPVGSELGGALIVQHADQSTKCNLRHEGTLPDGEAPNAFTVTGKLLSRDNVQLVEQSACWRMAAVASDC